MSNAENPPQMDVDREHPPSESFGCFSTEGLKIPSPSQTEHEQSKVKVNWFPNNPKATGEMPDKPVWNGIKGFYSHPSPLMKLLASLLNCYFTNAQGTFLCSFSILMRMIKDDPNLSITEEDFKVYNQSEVMKFLVDPHASGNAFFRQVCEGGEGAASVLTLSEPELVAAMEAGLTRETMAKQEMHLMRVHQEHQEKGKNN